MTGVSADNSGGATVYRSGMYSCDHMTVTVEDADKCDSCGSTDIEQDDDVLDTWFSSVFGLIRPWVARKNFRFKYFYPTGVLETGYDILFFWVARMIMMGIENTGQVPFPTVFPARLDSRATGAKMSKTRGNTLDPLELIDKYGTMPSVSLFTPGDCAGQ
ncbi:MAG: hypothetical protein CM1200mP22_25660 [Dehalococcoidia bacterium]|nr:MAG: hypothetical protein CM1200mP22_25660 [Dehalococcoidia bacterium]